MSVFIPKIPVGWDRCRHALYYWLRSHRPLAHHSQSGMVGKRANKNVPKFEERADSDPTLQSIWNKNSQPFFQFKKPFINSLP